jgi:hydroxyacylglutathione hydrolase
MNLLALPAFTDNYIWMLHDGTRAFVVDPGDAAPVHTALDALGLQLAGILVTHHHADHVGGVAALLARLNGSVWAPASERMPPSFAADCVRLREGDTLQVLGRTFSVLDLPGHTSGHIAYVQTGAATAPLLFCGDTLFSGGCGRLFEGTPAQMQASLAKLAALPGDTQVCCTHEYTLSNLRFATAADPDNAALAAHMQHCLALRAKGLATLPSSMGLELQINPFLRCSQPALIRAAQSQGAVLHRADNDTDNNTDNDALAVFTALREWKNRF